MLEIVQYILGDLLHFIGFIIILGIVFEGIKDIVEAKKK